MKKLYTLTILLKFDIRIIIHLEITCCCLLIKVLKIEPNWIIRLVGISTNHPTIEKLNNLTQWTTWTIDLVKQPIFLKIKLKQFGFNIHIKMNIMDIHVYIHTKLLTRFIQYKMKKINIKILFYFFIYNTFFQ